MADVVDLQASPPRATAAAAAPAAPPAPPAHQHPTDEQQSQVLEGLLRSPVTWASLSRPLPPRSPHEKTGSASTLRHRLEKQREDAEYFRTTILNDKEGRFGWVDGSDSALDAFAKNAVVKCTPCEATLTFRKGNLSELARHVTKRHIAAVNAALVRKAAREAGKARLGAMGVARVSPEGEVVTEGGLRDRARLVRAILTMKLVSDGLPMNAISGIFNMETIRAAEFCLAFSNVGKAHTGADDVQGQYKMLRNLAAEKMKGRFGTIVIDGASSSLEGGSHVSAVVWVPADGPPIALDFGVSKGSGDAPYYADIIREFCADAGIDILTHVVGVMGDNVTLNDNVAKLLGLPRFKCIPHACALAFKAICAKMGVSDFLGALHTVFTAGGSQTRRIEAGSPKFVALGMDVHAIVTFYPNRWYSASDLIAALIADGGKMLKKALPAFLKESPAMQKYLDAVVQEDLLEGDDGTLPDDLEPEPAQDVLERPRKRRRADAHAVGAPATGAPAAGGGPAAGGPAAAVAAPPAAPALVDVAGLRKQHQVAVASKALAALKAGLEDEVLIVKLAVVAAMTQTLIYATRACSANGDKVSPHAVSTAQNCQPTFQLIVMEGGPAALRMDVAKLLNVKKPGTLDYDDTLRLESTEELDVMIHSAAAAALEKCQHIEDWTHVLDKKELYDPRILHDVPDATRLTAHFFGADPAKWEGPEGSNVAVKAEYVRYCALLKAMSVDARKASEMRPSVFWQRHAATFPSLYKLGLWYAAVQTSSVAAERCFGIMRNVEAPNKRSMRSPAWRAELYFRYNKWLVDLKWDEAQVLVPRLDAAGAAPAAAGGASGAYFGPPA